MSKTITYDSQQMLKELYENEYKFITEDGQPFEIPECGSLGILAMGYQGLIAWRKQKTKKVLTVNKKNNSNIT